MEATNKDMEWARAKLRVVLRNALRRAAGELDERAAWMRRMAR